LTHYRRITDEELEKIELAANRIIFANLPVVKKIYPRTEAEQKFGFRIYQGGAVPGLELRIVSIGDIDHQACGGTHVDRTGEIGVFKIVKRESVQDGVERVTFKCYLAAVRYSLEREKLIKQMAAELGVPENQLPNPSNASLKSGKSGASSWKNWPGRRRAPSSRKKLRRREKKAEPRSSFPAFPGRKRR